MKPASPTLGDPGSGRSQADWSTVLLGLCALFIAYGTLIPFRFSADLGGAAERLGRFAGAPSGPISRSDVVSNVLLFLPWGGLYAIRSRRVAGEGPRGALLGAATSGLALSGLVEACQLFAPSRTASPIDLATNTIGAALGALLGWAFDRRLLPRWSPILSRIVVERPVLAAALAAAAGLLIAGLSPFDVSISLGDLRAAVRRARPIPFGRTLTGEMPPPEPWSWAQEGLSAVLFGGLFALALKEASRRGAAAVAGAAAAGGVLALAIEAAQLAIPSRVVDMTSVLIAGVGSGCGALVVLASPRRTPRRWIGPAIAAWGIVAALSAWTPPHPAGPGSWSLPWSRLVPFWAYYRRTDVYAVSDLVDQVLLFIPLGVLLAAMAPSGSRWRAALVGLGFGALLEAGQIPLAGRTAEITDALSAGAGAYLGASLWGWAVATRAAASRGGLPIGR
jgi:VanZ family protein